MGGNPARIAIDIVKKITKQLDTIFFEGYFFGVAYTK